MRQFFVLSAPPGITHFTPKLREGSAVDAAAGDARVVGGLGRAIHVLLAQARALKTTFI